MPFVETVPQGNTMEHQAVMAAKVSSVGVSERIMSTLVASTETVWWTKIKETSVGIVVSENVSEQE